MSEVDNKAPAQGDAAPVNPQETPASKPSDAATAAPAAPANADEMVQVKKSDFDALTGRQSALDKKEARLTKLANKLGLAGGFKKPATPAAPANAGDDDGDAEDEKAKGGLINLALDPAYRDVMDANPILRDMLTKNPLSVLPLYAPDALDADDAVDLVKEYLTSLKPAPAAENKPATPAKPAEETPKAGGENANIFGTRLAEEGKDDKEYTDGLKKGTTQSIADSIKHRITKSFKK